MHLKVEMFYLSLSMKYFIFLLWIFYLCFCAIFIFTKGFLQDRFVLDKKATCILSDSSDGDLSKLSSTIQICTKKNKTKAVIIIIDALRYDFVKFRDNVDEKETYRNNFRIVNEVSPANYKLYKFIAHPPTTTYQRLHGLTTGSLPTFVDIGNNFGSSDVKEDNLIDQLNSSGLKTVFIGDDTWTRIYRRGFYRSYPIPSFNVWDLDSEDEEVKELLFPEMKKMDWDVIIAHFLGVDHCDHVLGPNHPEMARKLSEMNEMITKVVNEMDDSTVLLVFGDHGMTGNGEHSGNSINEITSVLFVYSKKEDLISKFLNVDEVYQIDLVPTIANLFGIPIPFSNLGTTILSNFSNDVKPPLLDLWSNVNQVTLYINEYSKAKSFSFLEGDTSRFIDSYERLKENLVSASTNDEETFLIAAREYLKEVREMCQSEWIQFDIILMTVGISFMFLILAFGCAFTSMKRKHLENQIIQGTFLWSVFVIMMSTFLTLLFLHKINIASNFTMPYVCITSSFSLLFAVSHCNIDIKPLSWCKYINNRNSLSPSFMLVIIILATSSLCNSYIVEESSVVVFLLISLLSLACYNTKPVDIGSKKMGKKELTLKMFIWSPRGKVLGLLVLISILIRLSFFSWRCRDEQVPRCVIFKEVPKPDSCVVSVFVLAVYIVVSKKLLEYFGNLQGTDPFFFLIRHGPFSCVGCCACFWIIGSLPSDIKYPSLPFFRIHLFSKLAFLSCIVLLIIIFIKPLLVCLKSKTVKDCTTSSLKRLIREQRGLCNDASSTLFGLPTIYSATFINMSVFAILLISISLGGHRAVAGVLMLTSAILLVVFLSLLKMNKPNNSSPPNIWWFSVVCWGLSSSVFFYGTGHQTAFSTIQWESAGIFGDINSTFLPGILVTLNTFSSQIFHAMFLPVLFIMPYTLCHLYPNLSSNYSDSKKCEMDVYYEKSSRIHGVFSLILRYSLFLGFRVFMSMYSAFVHMGHLVTWNVFAPKLIFESAGFLVSLPFLLIGFLFVERISYQLDCKLKSSLNTSKEKEINLLFSEKKNSMERTFC
ncbi:GPI ethanolamine phosphate transferase 3 [Halyomorpha halys]|uniref:GPI ethanolamine phosphate transferase 3 n=1 Tax=Halyomorpha halys TaxID=286706 RepID=UPI0006D4D387|nr:GPI ethanolamine phosphate transferase 3-like [Halyomorpha halys]